MSVQRLAKALAIVTVAVVVAGCSNPEKKKVHHLQAGDALVAQKNYSEGIIEYRNALKQDEHFGEARWKLAKAYEQTKDYGRALREYVRAADLMPDNAEVQLAAARLLILAGRFEDGKARAENVLQADPKNVPANLVLGSALVGLKDVDGAIKQVEDAIAIDPLDGQSQATLGVLSLAKGDVARAEASFTEAVRVKPQSIEARISLASFFWMQNRLPEAEQELKAALQIDPVNDLSNRALAAFYIQSNRRAEAEPYLKTTAAKDDPRAKLALADYYIGMQRLTEAKDLLQSIEQNKQVGAVASSRLALIFFSEKRTADAYAIVDGLIAKGTDTASAYLVKGRFLLAEQKVDSAIEALRAAVKADPKLAAAQFMLGNALQAKKDLAGAVEAYKAALEVAPGATGPQLQLARVSLMRGDVAGSFQAASTALEKQPGNPLARLMVADALIGRREYSQAAGELAKLKTDYPKAPQVHVSEGKLLMAQGKHAEAARAFNFAVSLEAKSTEALAGLIAVDLLTRNAASAVTRSESLLQMRPGDTAVQLLAARAYYATKNEGKAEEMLKAVIQQNGRHAEARSMLGDLYTKQRKPQQALEQFQAMIAVDPKSVAANTMAGMVLQGLNRIPEAKAHYEAALETSPDAAVAANNLAWILADERQDLDRALTLANQASALRPTDPQVADTVGWVYMQKQLPVLAVPAFEKAVTSAPNNPEFLYHLGKAYAATGENAKARANLQKALAINANFNGAADARGLLSSLGS
jgi:tetratricopeptide (TPR) repeat protein